MIEGAARRSASVTRRRDSSSLKIARSRNSRQTYSAPIKPAEALASSRRMAEIASASCSALPQSPGVIVAIVTWQPASRSRIKVPAH